jgi:transposase
MQCEEDWAVLHALHEGHGWSIAHLAREFELNWRTARRYATAMEPPTYGPRARPAELTEAQRQHVERRLAGHPELRATTLHREVVELGYEGSYPSFARRVRTLRPADEPTEPQIRFETDPGVQVQADWADCGCWLLGDELVSLYAFVEVLAFSRMVALRFATDKTRPTTLRLLTRCLVDLGGAPQEVLTDRDRALVIGKTPSDRAVIAPEWIDLAATLGTRAKARRAHRPQTKAKVERVIREVKEDFLGWLSGQVLPARRTIWDYERLAERWRTEVVATRTHRTTKRVVGEAWSQERPLLRPIPERILGMVGESRAVVPARVIDLAPLRTAGEVVEIPPLAAYEAVTS